jgi:hypothetical protein
MGIAKLPYGIDTVVHFSSKEVIERMRKDTQHVTEK